MLGQGDDVHRALSVLSLFPLLSGAADFEGFPFVNDDGTLTVSHATVHLYGIHIPPTETTCYFFERPIPCGPRAILAMKFDIGTDFVKCDAQWQNADLSHVAICMAEGKNLSETLLSQGWAVALPDAPFEYHVLEDIARARGIGVWGIAIEPAPRGGRPPHRE